MLYTFPYDSINFNPAMPVVEIGIRSTDRDPQREIVLKIIIDSGADATLIPLRYLRSLKARFVRPANLVTITGDRTFVSTYRVSLRIGQIIIPSIPVIAAQNNQRAVLGRDVLNQLMVTLNGLASMTEITQ